jgi:organic hydroperoxide reductase OsmC/OhrA
MREHLYDLTLRWTGNTGSGTADYRAYRRDHTFSSGDKPVLLGSSDAHFRGDAARWNPEELLLASLAACHQLWYLHLCADAGIAVVAYEDHPVARMLEHEDGSGEFVRALLRPRVTIRDVEQRERALELHTRAHALCFIARSVNFPVEHEPLILIEKAEAPPD